MPAVTSSYPGYSWKLCPDETRTYVKAAARGMLQSV